MTTNNQTNRNFHQIAISDVDGSVTGVSYSQTANIAATANSVALANVVGAGNIASINLSGNAAQALLGNGVFAPVSATPAGNVGEIQFNDTALAATANLKWDSANVELDIDGKLAVTGNAAIGNISTANITQTGTINVTGFKEMVAGFQNTGSSIAPNAALGTVFQYVADNSFTFNGFTNPIAGQSITVIIKQPATSNKTMTSTMKFAGNNRTLSTTSNSTDMVCVFYTGTDYLASLTTGYE